MDELGGDGSGSSRRNTIPFRNAGELQKEAAMKENLEQALRGLEVALSGGGEKRPDIDEADRAQLSEIVRDVQEYFEGTTLKSLTVEQLQNEDVARQMTRVKVALAPYLSDEQYADIFGTDSLA